MTERGKALSLAGLPIVILGCFGWLLVCPHRSQCLNSVFQVDGWASIGVRVAVPLLGLNLAAFLLRLVWLLGRAAVAASRPPRLTALPSVLRAAASRTGVSRLTYLAGPVPAAFCVGALRPRVVITEGLLRCLEADELDAVLLHEGNHVRHLEPLQRAAREAAADAFFYVPLIRWWARWQTENAELRADRAALVRLGPQPVAAALWALGGSATLEGAAAFAGAAELRVAQILGDPMSRRGPEFSVVLLSVLGLYLAFQVASCLVQAAQHLI